MNNKHIVPYTMQLLVENVTKHNVISSQQHMTIQIVIDSDSIRISNPIVPRQVNSNSSFGLKYLTRLYESHGKEFTVVNDGHTFTAIVPYI